MPKKVNDQIDQLMDEADEARLEDMPSKYTHHFATPFEFEGETYKDLTFDFSALTGEDTINAEAQLRAKGITVIIPAVMPEYLAILCAMGCTYRNASGNRTVSATTIRKMPIRDFQTITAKARRFLMSAG